MRIKCESAARGIDCMNVKVVIIKAAGPSNSILASFWELQNLGNLELAGGNMIKAM